MKLAQRSWQVVRGKLQAYGTPGVRRYLWNHEFARGRWQCLDCTPGDCVYSFVEKYARQGSILDLGCGSGSTASEIAADTYSRYVGIDISDVAVGKARARTEQNGRVRKNRFLQSDILTFAPAQQFDVILLRDSIYYVPFTRIEAMLRRYASFLKESGVFIVRVLEWTGKCGAILELIGTSFDVVQRDYFENPTAAVVVFRPHDAEVCGS